MDDGKELRKFIMSNFNYIAIQLRNYFKGREFKVSPE